jgi:hypothetical protein
MWVPQIFHFELTKIKDTVNAFIKENGPNKEFYRINVYRTK